jgi:hypothetical protein
MEWFYRYVFTPLVEENKDYVFGSHIGVIDAQGIAAIFEVSMDEDTLICIPHYTSETDPYIVATNHPISSNYCDENQNESTCKRRERAIDIIEAAYDPDPEKNQLNYKYFIKVVARSGLIPDFTNPGNPVPPITELEAVNEHNTGNYNSRSSTRWSIVVHGVNESEDPRLTTLWINLGEPTFGVSAPLFSYAQDIPEKLKAYLRCVPAPLNAYIISREMTEFLYNDEKLASYTNDKANLWADNTCRPYPLWYDYVSAKDGLEHRAIQSYTLGIEDHVTWRTEFFKDDLPGNFNSNDLYTFQDEMAELIYEFYTNELVPR